MCKNENVAPITEGTLVEFKPQRIKLNVDQKGFDFEAEGYSEDFLLSLVTKLKGQNIDANVVSKAPINSTTTVAPQKVTVAPQSVEVDRVVVLHDEAGKSTLADKFGGIAKDLYATAGVTHQDDDTAFHHTGIKVKNGKNHYRCGYSCPKCGESGRHYIPYYVSAVSCHKCNTNLVVEPATDKGFGEGEEYRDEKGNYFYAEVIDYTTQR